MQLTEKHRRQIIVAFCLVFYVLFIHKWWNGFLLFQLKPHLFNTRFDLFTWLVMQSGLHKWLIDNPAAWVAFDAAFFAMPLLYWLAYNRNFQLARVVAIVMLLVNWTYIQCYTLYPANSIESFTAWLLFPLLFMAVSLQSFYFILNSLRYFFLFFFVSAAVWKFVQGGIFNLHQMSGTLLFQHKEYLASSPDYWYTSLIYWLINHPLTSYLLYAGATLLEALFIVGFFTKKYDRFLAVAFVLFVVADTLVMRIPYWEISPFLLTFYYGRYSMPARDWRGK